LADGVGFFLACLAIARVARVSSFNLKLRPDSGYHCAH